MKGRKREKEIDWRDSIERMLRKKGIGKNRKWANEHRKRKRNKKELIKQITNKNQKKREREKIERERDR